MCVAIIKPDGIKGPSDRMINHLWNINKDGAGFCVIRDGYVTGYKGFMDKDEFLHNYRTIVTKKDRALIHFRITTRGGTHPGGTHPFPAEQEEDMLNATYWKSRFGVVHNGTIWGMGTKSKGGLSDTQEFIQKYLHDRILLYSLFSNRGTVAREMLDAEIGQSRIAIMRFDGQVVALGDWSKAGGCLYSKQDYKGIEPKTQKKAYRKSLIEDMDRKKLNDKYDVTEYGKWSKNKAKTKINKAEDGKNKTTYIKDGKKIYFSHDPMLKRMVPFYTGTGERADDLIECPTCGSKKGHPCIYNDIECCSTCASQMINRGEILPDFLETEYEGCGDIFPAGELAGTKKGKNIRKVLKKQYCLEFCPALDLFLPDKVCLECGYVSGLNGKPECWLKKSAKEQGDDVYGKMLKGMADKLCYLEINNLEDVGGGRLSYDNFSIIEHQYDKEYDPADIDDPTTPFDDDDIKGALGFDMMDNKG